MSQLEASQLDDDLEDYLSRPRPGDPGYEVDYDIDEEEEDDDDLEISED